jgi:hypothetical protein
VVVGDATDEPWNDIGDPDATLVDHMIEMFSTQANLDVKAMARPTPMKPLTEADCNALYGGDGSLLMPTINGKLAQEACSPAAIAELFKGPGCNCRRLCFLEWSKSLTETVAKDTVTANRLEYGALSPYSRFTFYAPIIRNGLEVKTVLPSTGGDAVPVGE